MTRILAACFATACLALPAMSVAADDATADGRELYETFQCWQCHGYEGQGGAAPRLAPSAYPFEAFERFVRYPNQMPAYPRELLSSDDLQAIWEFVRGQPEAPDTGDVPALRDL